MLRIKSNTMPEAFEKKFEIIVHHHYPTGQLH